MAKSSSSSSDEEEIVRPGQMFSSKAYLTKNNVDSEQSASKKFSLESLLTIDAEPSSCKPRATLKKKTTPGSAVLRAGFEQQHSAGIRTRGIKAEKKHRKQKLEKHQSRNWKNTRDATDDEANNDLDILQMRNALSSTAQYKKKSGKVAKLYQTGTIIENAADFYSDRVPRKQRRQTLVDEILANHQVVDYQRKQYKEIVGRRTRGRPNFGGKLKKSSK